MGDAGGSVNRETGSWRGGMPRSGAGTPLRGAYSPRGGSSTPKGADRGRGRGRGGNHTFNDSSCVGLGAQKKAGLTSAAEPLSDLLYPSRPLLRPVKFVLTPSFQESEELLNPVSEEIGTTEDSHVPTAEHVARVFSGGQRFFPLYSESEGEASDQLKEIRVDLADLGKFRAEVGAVAGVTHQGPQEDDPVAPHPRSSILQSSTPTSGIRSPVQEDEDEDEGIPTDVVASRDRTQFQHPFHSSFTFNLSSLPVPSKQPRTRPIFPPYCPGSSSVVAFTSSTLISDRHQTIALHGYIRVSQN
ncbi:hypothetical protein BDN67DRAFT_594587 [Paxillus ammoniavirescens]|nr:hypothetical protein BDN67DRAFT_594587 [Paxillus ammoniavirescens]